MLQLGSWVHRYLIILLKIALLPQEKNTEKQLKCTHYDSQAE